MPTFRMVIARRLARTDAAASGMVAAEGRGGEALRPAGEIGREVNLLELSADPRNTALRAG